MMADKPKINEETLAAEKAKKKKALLNGQIVRK